MRYVDLCMNPLFTGWRHPSCADAHFEKFDPNNSLTWNACSMPIEKARQQLVATANDPSGARLPAILIERIAQADAAARGMTYNPTATLATAAVRPTVEQAAAVRATYAPPTAMSTVNAKPTMSLAPPSASSRAVLPGQGIEINASAVTPTAAAAEGSSKTKKLLLFASGASALAAILYKRRRR